MLLVLQRKGWAKNLPDTYITERLLIKWLKDSLFISFPLFFHSCLFLCVFLSFCWDSEHGGKQIKFKIQIFPYYVVEELCIVTDLVWVETEILFIIIYLRALFIN